MPVRSSATPPCDGQHVALERAPGAQRDHRHAVLGAGPQDRGDLLGGVRERDGVGLARGEARLVAAVQAEHRRRGREALAEQVAQRARGRLVHRAAASSSATTSGPVIGPRWPTPTICGRSAASRRMLSRARSGVQVVGLVRDVRGGRPAGHRRQVDRVADQRDAVGLPPQADLAGRVAGELDHLEAGDPLARGDRAGDRHRPAVPDEAVREAVQQPDRGRQPLHVPVVAAAGALGLRDRVGVADHRRDLRERGRGAAVVGVAVAEHDAGGCRRAARPAAAIAFAMPFSPASKTTTWPSSSIR